MYRMKILLLSLLAVFAVGSMASATASAALQGPWWMKRVGGLQFKIEPKEELQIKSDNFNPTLAPFRIVTQNNKIIECEIVLNKGWLWNGEHQGADEEALEFRNCFAIEPECKKARVAKFGSQIKVRTELMWKYRGEKSELLEQGQQKIYDVFAPRETPKQYKLENRAPFFTIVVPAAETCPEKVYTLWAEGKEAVWKNQQNKEFNVVWGTAALVEPQNQDTRFVTLNWIRPNVKQLHHQEKAVTAQLSLEDQNEIQEGAEIEGKIYLEHEFGEIEFGAWDQPSF